MPRSQSKTPRRNAATRPNEQKIIDNCKSALAMSREPYDRFVNQVKNSPDRMLPVDTMFTTNVQGLWNAREAVREHYQNMFDHIREKFLANGEGEIPQLTAKNLKRERTHVYDRCIIHEENFELGRITIDREQNLVIFQQFCSDNALTSTHLAKVTTKTKGD